MKLLADTHVMAPGDYQVQVFEWGQLTWMVSGPLGNSEALTVGRCEIKPGCENPLHLHPNCDEVLHVVSGRIVHRVEGAGEATMEAGDTISIPRNRRHNARNVGDVPATMMICFSSPNRETRGE